MMADRRGSSRRGTSEPAPAERYVFGPGVRLDVRGAGRARAHFAREYGPPSPAGGPADVEAVVSLWPGRPGQGARGGHKTARWCVAPGPPDARPLRVEITVAGGPPSFALSLVQGYYV